MIFLAGLKKIDDQIAAIDGTLPAAGAKRRGRRPGPVAAKAPVAAILSPDTPAPIADIVERVLQSGYKSNSKNFRMIVTQALGKDGRFKNVGRGLYVVTGNAPSTSMPTPAPQR